jgi:hypothetical protein
MAVISVWLGWIVAGRALRPVHAITAAARRASEENLGERIALTGPDDELKELADTFDAMLSRLEAAFASQRRFVANASHELRTPLTVMRTAIDVTLAKPGRTPDQLEAMAVEVRQAAERAEALIETLLTLARSDRGLGSRDQLDVAVLAEDALDAAHPAIRARGLEVRAALRPAAAVCWSSGWSATSSTTPCGTTCRTAGCRSRPAPATACLHRRGQWRPGHSRTGNPGAVRAVPPPLRPDRAAIRRGTRAFDRPVGRRGAPRPGHRAARLRRRPGNLGAAPVLG